MKIDRDLQNRILMALADAYPASVHHVDRVLKLPDADEYMMLANLAYLEEHGLIHNGYKMNRMLSGASAWSNTGSTTITATGLDFIAADGGLGAILNTITVKLDAVQFAELLASKVEGLANVPAEERSELAKAIRKLPATAVEKVAEKMLDWTVDHAGDALPLLRALVGMGV